MTIQNPKKRVLMLVENNGFPSDSRVRAEAFSLVEAGVEVSVIAPGKKGRPRYENVNGVHTYRFRQPAPGDSLMGYVWEYGWSMFASFWLTIWVFFRRGFNVIHAHNPPDMYVFIAMCYRIFGVRFVFDHHDLSPEMYYARFPDGGNKLLYNILVIFEKLSSKWATHIISTNESYKKMVMERSAIPGDRITVVRNGPNLSLVKPVPPDPELRNRASTILGYVGVMGQQDGVDYFIRAMQILINELGHTDVLAIIIGRGEAVPDLKKLTAELGLEKHVEFAGRASDEDLLKILSTADICVDPDPYNPFNDRSTMIKMMEYMALAKPIVAFDLTEHRATAQDAALYATGNDEREFAANIAKLIADPELRQSMGDFGLQRMRSKLAWHHQEQNLLDVYEKLGFRLVRREKPTETDTVTEPPQVSVSL